MRERWGTEGTLNWYLFNSKDGGRSLSFILEHSQPLFPLQSDFTGDSIHAAPMTSTINFNLDTASK